MSNDYVSRTLRAYNNNPDKYHKSTAAMVLKPELDWLVDHLNARNRLVLDAGCAYGRDMAYLRTKNVRSVGIDMSEKLLELGRRIYPGMEFHKMDVRKLNFDDKTFGGIWCSAVLLHLTDKDITAALREFHRVLDDEGIIFISFKAGHGSQELVESFSADEARFYNFQTSESTKKLLKAAGFRVVKLEVVNERKRFGADKRNLDWVHCFSIKNSI